MKVMSIRSLTVPGLVAATLALTACPGMRFPALAPAPLGSDPSGADPRLSPASPAPMGQLSVAIRWPEREAGRQVQAIPVAANFLSLKVFEQSLTAQTVVATASFTRPAPGVNLVATASIPLRLGQVVKVIVNAYKDVQTEAEPDSSLVIAQGVQENVSVSLASPTRLSVDIDPEVIVAGIGGTSALGLDTILREDIPDPKVPALWTQLNGPDHLVFDPRGRYLYFTQEPDPGRLREGDYLMRLCMRPDAAGTPIGNRNFGNLSFIAGGSVAEGLRPDSVSALETVLVQPEALGVVEQPLGSGRFDLYFSEAAAHTVRRVRDGAVDTIAGTFGRPSEAGLASPGGLAVQRDVASASTYVFIVDSGNQRVQLVEDGAAVSTRTVWSATPTSTDSTAVSSDFVVSSSYSAVASVSCPLPRAVAIASNPLNQALLYIGGGDRVIELNRLTQQARTVMGGAGSDAALLRQEPFRSAVRGVGGLAARRVGNDVTLFVADQGNGCVWRIVQPFTGAGALGAIATPQVVIDGLVRPAGVSFSADGASLLVADTGANLVRRFTLASLPAAGSETRVAAEDSAETIGGLLPEPFESVSAAFTNAGFVQPVAFLEPQAGQRLVLDRGVGRIRRLTASGVTTIVGMGPGKRYLRGSGLNAARFHLGDVKAIDLDRSSVTAANLSDGTALPRLVMFAAGDDDSDPACVEVSGLAGLEVTANGTDRPTPATCNVLFENMVTRDVLKDAARVLDGVTGITLNPKAPPVTPPFVGTPQRQAELLSRFQARTGPLAVSVDGRFSVVHSWDNRFREWSYGINGFAGQGYRVLAGTGPSGTNANGPGSLIQVEKPRLARYDIDGNLYFVTASKEGTLLRRILRDEPLSEQGLVQTVAGGGKATIPLIGTGRPVLATNADLGSVTSLDVDTQGQVYLASGGRLYRFNRDGSILMMYESKKRQFKSIAFDEQDQAIYFTTEGEPYIRKVFFPRSS